MYPLQIFGPVGPDQENALGDVSRVATALADVGESGAWGASLSGRWDDSFDNSVKSFQDDHGLDIDGVLLPGGPTENEINLRLRARSEPGQPMVAEPAAGITKTDENALAAKASLELGHDRRRGLGRPNAEDFSSGATDRTNSAERLGDASEHDRSLTDRGFNYRPDPMGRLGWGDWIAPDGAVMSAAATPRIAGEEAKPQETPSRKPIRDTDEAPANDGYKALMREVVRVTKPEYFEDPQAYLDALEAAVEDGAVPANDGREILELFQRIILAQRGFGAKTMRIPGALGARQKFPQELTRRLDGVSHDRTRLAIEQSIKGSVPEKRKFHPDAAFVVKKLGTRENMVSDFWTAVRLAGGTRDNIEYLGERMYRYTTPNGTVFIMRRFSRDGRPTNEFHIESPGGGKDKIKIRYTTRPDDLKMQDE